MLIDLFSWRMVGWAISNRVKQDPALHALNIAIKIGRPPPGCTSPKAKAVWRHNWQTLRDVELFEYINGFHNLRRRHSALGCKSPLAFEPRAAEYEHQTGTDPLQIQNIGCAARAWIHS